MLVEDAGLELFNVEDIMLIKKVKVILGHLRVNDRIGVHIRSNIVHSQILSGLDENILTNNSVTMKFWPEEIGQLLNKLGAVINIEHWLPTPLITGEIPIIKKAMEMYDDDSIILKINEIRMYHKIVYLSEIDEKVQFYNHHIKFPEVKKKKGWYISGINSRSRFR